MQRGPLFTKKIGAQRAGLVSECIAVVLIFNWFFEPPAMSQVVHQDEVQASPSSGTPRAPSQPPSQPLGQPQLQYQSYEAIDTLMADLNAWGKQQGLGFIKRRTGNLVDGLPIRVTISCDCGFQRPSKATTKQTSTSKTNCPWEGVATSLKKNGRHWTFEIKKTEYNHETSTASTTHQVHRGLTSPMKTQIRTLSATPGI